jgi:subtilisin-like proprotein convertase family protein
MSGTIWQTPVLTQNTKYFWRVRTINPCGVGEWSLAYDFKTGTIICHEPSMSSDVPLVIPTTASTITSSLAISGLKGTISDLDVVDLFGTHSYLSDLTIRIKSPQGTEATLVTGICGDLNNFNISFDDEATTTPPCPYTTGTAHKPASPLSVFDGLNPNGIWVLTVIDSENFDGGNLNGWGLKICTVFNSLLSADTLIQSGCQSDNIVFTLQVDENINTTDMQLTAVGLPASVVYSFVPNPIVSGSTVMFTMSNLSSVASGAYPFSVVANSAVEGNDTLLLTAVVKSVPSTPELLTPTTQDIFILNDPIAFDWSDADGADSYLLQVTCDTMNVANICESIEIDGVSTYTMAPNCGWWCAHFWRIVTQNSCGSVATPYRLVHLITSATDKARQFVTVYPNPASAQAVLAYEGALKDDVLVSVVDVTGRCVADFIWPMGQKEFGFSTQEWPSGHYILHLRSSDVSGGLLLQVSH